MKIAGSPALIAAQVYASSAVQARDTQNAQAARRQAAKFEIKDDVAVRADKVEDQAPGLKAKDGDAPKERGEGVGRREAPIAKQTPGRPGSLVDLTA